MAACRAKGTARPLVISAHLDTVFPFDTDLQVKRDADKIFGPGIGDNSLGLAGLFGLYWALRQDQAGKRPLPGDVWLVANVGEEGLGDLRGMRAVVDRFGAQCAGLPGVGRDGVGSGVPPGAGGKALSHHRSHCRWAFLGGLWEAICDPRAGGVDHQADGFTCAHPAALQPQCRCDRRRHQCEHDCAGRPSGAGSALGGHGRAWKA